MNAPWVLGMVWHDICFLHWRADAAQLKRSLPPNVELDCYDGDAWLSVVPFRMTGIRLRCAPAIPGFTDVPEINLRTYVRVGGKPGIWFFSLDADGPLLVRSARIMTGLPYYEARISTHEDARGISYTSERTDRAQAGGNFHAQYRAPLIQTVVEADSLAAFLHERYRFFATRRGRLVWGSVQHDPWSLGATAIDITENTLGSAIGHPLTGAPQHAYFARRQDVHAGFARRV